MSHVEDVYRTSLTLLTDLYQLTMAQAYWASGSSDKEAVFHLFFRKNPFDGGFAVSCGQARAAQCLSSFRFTAEDVGYLATLSGNDGRPLFDPEFLKKLESLELALDVDTVPEGTVVFPHEPLVRVRGPILHAQLVETVLLNAINFETLIATKAARVCLAARGDKVIDFGLRRAQGFDGGLSASRAAFVGGCSGTSNVLAGRLFGIPAQGTHAHSWVMSFPSELEAFAAYAEAQPNNCVLLIDTYDTLEGARNAARVGRRLRERGHDLAGVRLDSGDLAWLSIEVRKILDAAGFAETAIVASNNLDEHVIASLKEQGAAIDVWGVGTRLVTGGDEPALGGVYKLGAVRRPGDPWQHRLKLSEQAVKTTNPGVQQVRRYENDDGLVADVIYDEKQGPGDETSVVDPVDPTRLKRIPSDARATDLLEPVMRAGRILSADVSLEDSRARAAAQLGRLHVGIKRFVNPHQYPVGLAPELRELKTRLIKEARGDSVPSPPSPTDA